jgi:hypothetical protein
MQRYLWALPVVGSWAALLVAASAAPAGTQGDQKPAPPKPVDIVTVDHVELKAKFFPSTLGKAAPCVMLLHAIGETESSNNKEWTSLARTLQKKGYAVLAFDFRGHGDSKTVKPGTYNTKPELAVRGFWDEPYNQKLVKGLAPKKPRPTEINFKDFSDPYYTFLCNDIAAARAFLDERNDAGECNSANLIIIGAKDGATLGALWLNSECQRYRFLPDMGGSIDKENPEGKCVTGAVWLSIAGKFSKNKQAFSVPRLLEVAGKRDKVPMLFLYGDGDDPGKKLALDCEKYIRGKNDKDYPFTAAMKVKDAEGAAGRELLLGSLDTTKQIVEFLEGAQPKKGVQHKARADEQMKHEYVWVWRDNSGRQFDALARGKGKPLVVFSSYASFLK